MAIRIALLGQPLVLSDERAIALPRKTLNVLGYLILNRRRATNRDTVAFTVFPDEDEDAARAALRRNLSELIAALPDGRQLIEVEGERIVWRADALARVDVIAFEDAVREGRYADAIAEYGGALLPTIYDEWATADRERLRDIFHDALSCSVSAERASRRYDLATTTAHRLLDEDPWREDIVRQLMAIRYEAGDRAGALAAFERFATLLRSEMHTEPMPETFAVRDAVLRGALLATSEPQRAAVATMESTPGLPFVGRDAAMERAHRAWQGSAAGRTTVLFVSGEAGVGKTRFTTELVRIAEREGGFIVRGYTSAGGEQKPYESFAEALSGGRALFDDYSGPTLADDRAARLRLFESVRRRLSDLSRRRPVVMVLEDLHWAHEATIDLLDFVVRHLETAAVLIVGTTRSDELARAHPLRTLRRRLHDESFAVEIELGRLTIDDATRAARGALPDAVDETALERMLAWVDGVPLLLAEAVRDLAAGRASAASSMTALVGERFEHLSPNAETALAFGAVVGERFDLETLVAATGWRDAEVLDAIGEAIEYGFVRAASRRPGLSFAFTHDLVRVAATKRISESDLTRAHGLVARAIVAQSPDDRARAGEIARHFAAASESRRAAEYFRNAARYALDVFANEDARETASAGLALCDETDPSQRALRYELVEVRERGLARIGEADARRADAELLEELAAGDVERSASALERLIEALRGNPPAQQEAFARFEALTGESERIAAAYERTVSQEAELVGDFQRAAAAALRAVRLFDALGDADASLRARILYASTIRLLGERAALADFIAELRPIAERCTDLSLRFRFYVVASAVATDGDRDLALADAKHALDLALQIGDRYAEALSHHNVAFCAGYTGDTAQSIRENERAIAVYREIGDASGAASSMLNLASTYGWGGDYERAFQLLDELEAVAAAQPWVALQREAHSGSLWLRAGDLQKAAVWLERAHEGARQAENVLYAALLAIYLAELRARRGDVRNACNELDAARVALEELGLHVSAREAAALSARMHAELGVASAARTAIAEAISASSDLTSIELPPKSWWDLAVASALLDDRTAAERFAHQAARQFCDEALAMPPDLAECFGRLPWHIDTFAFLARREVPLTLSLH